MKMLAFLGWMISLCFRKSFFLHWIWWNLLSSFSGFERRRKEILYLIAESDIICDLPYFFFFVPEAKCTCYRVCFHKDSEVRVQVRSLHGIANCYFSLDGNCSEFLKAITSSNIVFHEALEVGWTAEQSCKYMEAFGNALCQFALKKFTICIHNGSAINMAKHVSSMVLENGGIEDLSLEFIEFQEPIGKLNIVEFMAYFSLPHILQILKSLKFSVKSMDGEVIEQLIKPFKSPHSRLKNFCIPYLMSSAQLEHISNMLVTSTSLTTLDIDFRGEKVFQSGYTSLGVALSSNKSLKCLKCRLSSSAELKALLNPLLSRKNNVQCNTTLTKLELEGNIEGKEGIEILVELLCTNSTLLELRLYNVRFSYVNDSQESENILAILEALKTNTSLKRIGPHNYSGIRSYKVLGAVMDLLLHNHCIEDIDFFITSMERSTYDECVQVALSKRKEMKLWDIVQGMANVSPTSGRVFLCGQPLAGKTRLRKSMKEWFKGQEKEKVENTSKWRKKMWIKPKVVKTPKVPKKEVLLQRTRGIEVDNVLCDGIGITIWDMAGQTDYHSFHELVMPNLSTTGSCSMFLLICNPMEETNLSEPRQLQKIKDELQYWLRFIASNTRRSHSYRPHVSIVMTHFDYWKDDLTLAMCMETMVKDLKSQFEEFLTFDEDRVVLKVDGMDVSHAGGVFDSIKSYLTNLLGRLPKTLGACEEVQLHLAKWNAKWNAKQSNPQLLKWEDFCENMCKDVKDFNIENHELAERRKVFVAISLNDGGHIIYNEKEGVVITNPHWFCHDIVGEFLYQCANKNPKLEMVSPNGVILIDHVKHSILGLIKDHGNIDEKFDDILDMMKKLNICFEQDTKSIMLPSFLNNYRHLSWSQSDESSSFKYIGRRLACKEQFKTMITPGFFARLQVSFFKMLPHNNDQDTYEVFLEVIKFISDGIEVILQFNDGDIDILLRSSQPKDKVLLFLNFHVIGHIKSLQGNPTLGCIGVHLIEYILQPKCVKRLLDPKDRKSQFVHMKDLEMEVVIRGVNATHNWKPCNGLGVQSDKVSKLLGNLAWHELLERRSHDLQRYHKKVLSLGDLTQNSPFQCEDETSGILTPSLWQRSQNFLFRPLDVKLDTIINLEKEIMSKLDEVIQSIKRLEDGIENMEKNLLPKVCSKMDDLLAFSMEMQKAQFPKLAYLCEMGSRKLLTQFVPGLDNFKLHLMCESMRGFHEVANQEGCTVHFGTDGTRRFLGILACGLKMATILTKIGAHVVCGMGSMVPDFSDGFKFASLILDTSGILDYKVSLAILESLPLEERKHLRISTIEMSKAQEWLRDFLEPQCQDEREFHKKFKLRKVIYKKGRRSVAWMCDMCRKEQCNELQ